MRVNLVSRKSFQKARWRKALARLCARELKRMDQNAQQNEAYWEAFLAEMTGVAEQAAMESEEG